MSPEYQRTPGLYRFALRNYRDLQKDVSRGSGDYLTTFAFLLCGGDSRAGTLAVEESVRSGQSLASASTAHAFVRAFDRMLAGSPDLLSYRLDCSERTGPPPL